MREKEYISALLLFAFFGMTLFGLSSSSSMEFLRFIPYVFVISAVVLVANNKYHDAQHYFFYALVLVLSFAVHLVLSKLEVEELNPNYATGSIITLFGVPLIIPIIWFFLINTVNGILRRSPFNDFFKSVIGAFMVTIMDVFLEAQAQKFHFWNWREDQIPFENYAWWFLLAFGFLMVSFKLNVRNHRFTSVAGYILLFLFFIASDAIEF